MKKTLLILMLLLTANIILADEISNQGLIFNTGFTIDKYSHINFGVGKITLDGYSESYVATHFVIDPALFEETRTSFIRCGIYEENYFFKDLSHTGYFFKILFGLDIKSEPVLKYTQETEFKLLPHFTAGVGYSHKMGSTNYLRASLNSSMNSYFPTLNISYIF